MWELLEIQKEITLKWDLNFDDGRKTAVLCINLIEQWFSLRNNFLKVVVPTILEFVRKIVICGSSHT
ncbi:hypothetical protein LEP1GSC008_2604 [Leptospira kirschneri serovar Bulgarica str. Nikolaevo]|uniref:Uncharacterized protein n=2 Tax=Leptospira kirschneri TaxID=29507 RepID=A0A0E2BDF3_9LEPT|nr:hypothetical protein LEP1GSC081_1031 [Leptospira kirschneri str. H1]EMK24571.1 hypothetical protein LEP1GSC008_2604 [Leptospira kirschneri serovar Bulgarica str. Nikolaevo]